LAHCYNLKNDRLLMRNLLPLLHFLLMASNALRKQGVLVSPSGVHSLWWRHQLGCFRQRHSALEKQAAAERLGLTESQVQHLTQKEEDIVYGAIKTDHPGYLGAQDTCYVGPLKSGRSMITSAIWRFMPLHITRLKCAIRRRMVSWALP
jgi:hypothetical protein